MLQTLKLLLPALIPSWRFFDVVAPSPRIEFALLETPQDAPERWQTFRPRPSRLSLGKMLLGLVWNPRWNESLFLVSCAERLLENPTEHSDQEIFNRIASELARGSGDATAAPYLQYRLVLVSRDGTKLERHTAHTSEIRRAVGNDRP